MNIFDGHCDVLWKMWERGDGELFTGHDPDVHCSLSRLRQGRVAVQTMAVFVPPSVDESLKLKSALQMIDQFYEYIVGAGSYIRVLQNMDDLRRMQQANCRTEHRVNQSRQPADAPLYVLLAVEGAAPLQKNLHVLRLLHRLGVRSIGLAWNDRNHVADGVGEPNPGGLTAFGREVVSEMNRLRMAIDVSHMAEQGFWDCLVCSTQPVMASHSNARALCDHPRNLSDNQLRAVFDSGGLVGITFVPAFLSANKDVTLLAVLKHVDYMLSLGGEDHIAFGSDFDGTDDTLVDMRHSGQWENLKVLMQAHFPETVVEKIFYHNWINYYTRLWSKDE